MYLKIKTVTLRNFLSVGAVTQAVDLSLPGMTLVLGENLDSPDGLDRNGTGKTTISQAVYYAFYGKSITGISLGNLINEVNGGRMLVTVDFEKNGIEYRIERGRKPDTIKLFVDGKDFAIGSRSATEDEIMKLVGMSSKLFQYIVCLSTYTTSFHKSESKDQKLIVEELVKMSRLTEKAAKIKESLDNTKKMVLQEKATLDADIAANARIEAAISETEEKANRWDDDQQRIIAEIETALTQLEFFDMAAETDILERIQKYDSELSELEKVAASRDQQYKTVDNAIESLNRQINNSRMMLRDYQDRSGEEIRNAEEDIKAAASTMDDIDKQIAEIEAHMSQPHDHCDMCGQSVEGESAKSIIASLTSQIDKLKTQRETIVLRIETAAGRIAQAGVRAEEERQRHDNEMNSIRSQITTMENEKRELISARDSIELIDIATAKIALGDRPVSRFQNMIALQSEMQRRDRMAAQYQEEKSRQNALRDQIDTLKGTLKDISFVAYDTLHRRQQHEEYLHRLLTHKDSFIRKDIIERSLSTLNERMAHYLDKLGLPHEVEFQNDMSVAIDLRGRARDYGQMSRGEANRIDLATSFAFRDMWESTNHPINLFWVDELLDAGISEIGATYGLNVFKEFIRNRGKNIFLISHRDTLRGKIDQTLLVRKSNDFTSLSME